MRRGQGADPQNGFSPGKDPAVDIDQLHRLLEIGRCQFGKARRRSLRRFDVEVSLRGRAPPFDPSTAERAFAVINEERPPGWRIQDAPGCVPILRHWHKDAASPGARKGARGFPLRTGRDLPRRTTQRLSGRALDYGPRSRTETLAQAPTPLPGESAGIAGRRHQSSGMTKQTCAESLPHQGKIAVVTGASRGIGRAIAVQLAKQGATVMLTARDDVRLQAVATEVRALGQRAAVCAIDLRVPTAAAQIVDATLSAFGAIDILVNNAGATKRGDFLQLTDDDWSDGFALKLHGAVRLSRSAWPHLKRRRGSIVNIAGVGGRTPGADFTIGGSVNGALLSFTKALADVGVRDGIQVNAINPGYIRTDRFQARLQQRVLETGESLEQAEASIVSQAEIIRLGEPDDIAQLVSFVVSPQARYLQGALIDADGGQTKTV